jgi:hypothetical protein
VAKKADKAPVAESQRRIPPRIAILGLGVLLGAAWGSVMWMIFEVAGRETGVRGWGYLALTMAMIGGGVAAIFGANAARRRGERISPKIPYRRRK